MVNHNVLVTYCDQLLNAQQFADYCPNGLQVEGKADIKRLITGVTASHALIEKGIAEQADALLVHHGYFWKNEPPVVCGTKRLRLQALLSNDINLIAYHLPLDAHSELGNNAQLAKRLALRVEQRLAVEKIDDLLWIGELTQPQSGQDFSDQINQILLRQPLYIPGQSSAIKRIAWCTGAAESLIEMAAGYDVDAYLTGEASEASYHLAKETGLHFYAAGHHATERYGVQALGEHLAEKFDLDHQYIDIDNPI